MAEAPLPGSEVRAFLSTRDNQFMIASIVFAYVALALSVSHAIWPAWALALVGAFYCALRAFERTWYVLLLFVVVYALAFLGVVSILVLSQDGGHFYLTGLLTEAFALYIIYAYVKRVKESRDAAGIRGQRPLGIWSLSLLVFFALSNASVVSWFAWGKGLVPLFPYLAIEGLLIPPVFYVLAVAERMETPGRYEPDPAHPGTPPAERCPACGAALVPDFRLCPHCNTRSEFMWCPDSEEYIDKCPKCGTLLRLGSEKCGKCGASLQTDVTCASCRKRAQISDWKPLKPA